MVSPPRAAACAGSSVLLSACRLFDRGRVRQGSSLELEAQENGERLLGREGDPVCLPGVPTHLGDLQLLGSRPEAVAAVAAEIVTSEHVAGDAAAGRLDPRYRAVSA